MQAAPTARPTVPTEAEMQGLGPAGFDITGRNQAIYNSLMSLPTIRKIYSQFLQNPSPTSQDKRVFTRRVFEVLVESSQTRACYDVFNQLMENSFREWDLKAVSFANILAMTLDLRNQAVELEAYLAQNFPRKTDAQKRELIIQLINVYKVVTSWVAPWHAAMAKIVALPETKEAAETIADIMRPFSDAVTRYLTSLGNDAGGDDIMPIYIYMASCHVDNPDVLIKKLEKLEPFVSLDENANVLAYLRTALTYFSPVGILNSLREAKLADLDKEIFEIFKEIRRPRHVPNGLNESFLSVYAPTPENKEELFAGYKELIEFSYGALQIEAYSKLFERRKEVLVNAFSPQAFYDKVLSIVVRAANFQKALEYLDHFCAKYKLEAKHYSQAFWQSLPEMFWKEVDRYYGKTKPNENSGEQLARLSTISQASLPLLKKIELICSVKSNHPHVQAVQRHLVRHIIKGSKELNKKLKAEFDQGFNERLNRPGSSVARVMVPQEADNTYWWAFGIGAVLLAGAIGALAKFLPPLGLALIGYIGGGFCGSMAGGIGIGILARKLHIFAYDRQTRGADADIANEYIGKNMLKVVPNKIAEQDKAVPMSERDKTIRAVGIGVGVTLATAAIITLAVLCPPTIIIGLAIIPKVLAIAGISLAPLGMGWVGGKIALACFGGKPDSPPPPASQPLLANVGGPQGHGATAPAVPGSALSLSATNAAGTGIGRTAGDRTPARASAGAAAPISPIPRTRGSEYSVASPAGSALNASAASALDTSARRPSELYNNGL